MHPGAITTYVNAFANLNRQSNTAPHKPILPLAVLDEIQRSAFPDNEITPTPELVERFKLIWAALVPAESKWLSRMNYPYRHLYQKGFWHFVSGGEGVKPLQQDHSLK